MDKAITYLVGLVAGGIVGTCLAIELSPDRKQRKECEEELKAFKYERIGLKEDILILQQSIFKSKESK